MKKILIVILLCFSFQTNYSQENYTINGKTLGLITEVDGNIDLLWNSINGEFRYFIRTKDGTITELKNTKASKRTYLEEYKNTLSGLTNGMSTDKLKFTRNRLKKYIDTYNTSVDSSYISAMTTPRVDFRLGFSGGITNNPFVGNPENVKVPLIGTELEIYDANVLPRHSGFLQARHTFDNDDFQYSTTELSLGYRYKFIMNTSFSIYAQVKLTTVNFTNFTYMDENAAEISKNDTSFDVPLIFGIGSDIKVGENCFITIIFGELFALALNNQGNLSNDFSIGYKFNL